MLSVLQQLPLPGHGCYLSMELQKEPPDTESSWFDWQLFGISAQPALLGWNSQSLSSLSPLKADCTLLHPHSQLLLGKGGWKVPSCTALSRAAWSKWAGTEPCEQGQHHILPPPWFFTGSCFWTWMKRNLLAKGWHPPQNPHLHSRWSQNSSKMVIFFFWQYRKYYITNIKIFLHARISKYSANSLTLSKTFE